MPKSSVNQTSGTTDVTGDIVPGTTATYDLGSATNSYLNVHTDNVLRGTGTNLKLDGNGAVIQHVNSMVPTTNLSINMGSTSSAYSTLHSQQVRGPTKLEFLHGGGSSRMTLEGAQITTLNKFQPVSNQVDDIGASTKQYRDIYSKTARTGMVLHTDSTKYATFSVLGVNPVLDNDPTPQAINIVAAFEGAPGQGRIKFPQKGYWQVNVRAFVKWTAAAWYKIWFQNVTQGIIEEEYSFIQDQMSELRGQSLKFVIGVTDVNDEYEMFTETNAWLNLSQASFDRGFLTPLYLLPN